ncbi:hypothetical protein G6F40_016467 [Rhizopus arrhizus]|nr:hypothetical protein G6F40_016467 [Rhizopus arrhizus]
MPLIADTGGQNAMVVDSSALSEQVVFDVLSSAFDSAGQRCSALRVLCVQEDNADHVLTMLRGAMRELSVGNPDRLPSRGPGRTEWRMPPWHLRGAHHHRNRPHQRTDARSIRPGAARGALHAR